MPGLTPEIGSLINSSNRLVGLPTLDPKIFTAAPTLGAFGAPLPKFGATLKTPRKVSALQGSSPAAVISKNARRLGLDPAAVLAYALEESSARYGAVGDHGTSFGPFQAHIGGAAGNRSAAAASAWANSPQGLIEMMGMMSRTPARGLKGDAAVRAIYQYFGKGTPLAVPKGLARYSEAQKILNQQPLAAPTVNVNGHMYVNPIPAGSQQNRTDQGVDFQAPPGSTIKAIGDAQVVSISNDPGGFGKMVVYKLTRGPLAGKYIYVGHTVPLVGVGQRLKAGQAVTVAHRAPGSSAGDGWVEIGYAAGGSLTQARERGETARGHADTLSGKQFLALLHKLGLK